MNETDELMVINALRSAAAKYTENAAFMQSLSDDAFHAVAAQFRKQADDCRRIADAMENPPSDPNDEDDGMRCTNPGGHEFVIQEGDDIHGEGRSYCQWCGADGDG
jgi:hypothetical protein